MTTESFTPVQIVSKLVEVGFPLKEVAMIAGTPAAPRKLPSSAADMVQIVINALQTENLGQGFALNILPKLKLWAMTLKRADSLGPYYDRWVAEHILEIPGTTDQVWSQLFDIMPWVRASLRKQAPQHVFTAIAWRIEDPNPFPDDKFIGRPFHPDMTVKTVMRLTHAWREALAKEMQAKYSNFPAPWLQPCVIGPYTITPITHCADLYREGHTVRYGGIWNHTDKISTGMISFYSVRKHRKRLATLELIRKGESVELNEVLGFLDPQTTTDLLAVVEPWLREQRGLCLPTIPARNDAEFPW